jgi:hypothetical protein
LALRGELKREAGKPAAGLADVMRAVRLDSRGSCDFDFLGAEPPQVRQDEALAWVYAWRGGVRRQNNDLKGARADRSARRAWTTNASGRAPGWASCAWWKAGQRRR